MPATGAPPELQERYKALSELERRLWDSVKGEHPGQPEHNAVLWEQWLAAANELQEVWKQICSGGRAGEDPDASP